MRLISAIVRNYRVHHDVTVEFDPERTLIGGPNESGKSTLIEAVHKALFLRAKITGEAQKSMVSHSRGGHPEVEVGFTARGRTFRLLKRFSGATGTVTLTEVDGPAWHADEAESRLAEMLGVEVVRGGRGGADIAAQQWGHVWVWQGRSGDDPTGDANRERDALIARLQSEGGAAAIQSEHDTRLAKAVAARIDALFRENGEPRAGTELARAISDESAAALACEAAKQSLARLEQAVVTFREASETIRMSEAALGQSRTELDAVDFRLGRVTELRAAEQAHGLAATTAAEKHDALVQEDARIRSLRTEIASGQAALAPHETEIQRLSTEETDWRAREAGADEACQAAVGNVQQARLRAELAKAHVQRIEKAAHRDQLATKLEQVTGQRVKLAGLETQLARTPAVTAQKSKTLQKLEGDCSNFRAAMEAMAAGLEVVSSDVPVKIDGHTLTAGQSHTLTEVTDVAIGPHIRLRLRPGGGSSLAEARQKLQQTQASLEEKLASVGVTTVAEAVEFLARRQQIETEILSTRARLDGLGADTIDADSADAANACAAIESEIERRTASVPDFDAPLNLADARTLATRSAHELGEAEAVESAARVRRETVSKQFRECTDRLTAQRSHFEAQRRAVHELDARMRAQIETHGDDAARAQSIEALLAARTAAEDVLAQTRRTLAELQPELIERDRQRCRRALDQHAAAKNDAEQKRAVARAELDRDGISDPHADLALAEARLVSAREHRASLERQAGAIRLLHRLFLEEQQALADQLTGPLANRISSYLECLFGAGARAEISLDPDNHFTGLRLVRPGHESGAFDFAALSGGTCEQLAAAVRLATAEVLAPAHDGCLPVVFDDAFAYSDPDRVKILQRMLDHAASRGLQIIILTCNPADYATLGARQISLRPNG
jgi:DNA repair exonuclease SbcCD ATPase subunit